MDRQRLRILVGIDFSECSERALLRAIGRAREEDAQLELVHVFEWDDAAACSGLSPAERAHVSREVMAQAQISLRHLGQLCTDFVGDLVPAEVHVVIGDPARGLLQAAEQLAVSRIVLGEIGRRLLQSGTPGATAERVCRQSAVPVQLVPELESAEPRHPLPLFSAPVEPPLWSCGECGSEQPPFESTAECAFCGNYSRGWVSVPEPQPAQRIPHPV